MAQTETSFPRGSKHSNKSLPSTPHPKHAIRAVSKDNVNPKKRKRGVSISTEPENEDNVLHATAANNITYKQIQDDMLLLGCIRHISPFTLDVELPGKTGGKVEITSISESFTNLLKSEVEKGDVGEDKDVARLHTMFSVGQSLPTKVIDKSVTSAGETKVRLSIDPAIINSNWNFRIFKKGLLVWAAVISKLDHGYHLNAGVKNSRIFLPFKDAGSANLIVGQPLWCVVQSANISATVSTIKVSILKQHLQTAKQSDLSLHQVVPGMMFDFLVEKSVKHGLQGEYMDDCVGYINESYLSKPGEKLSKYKHYQTYKAWVLYIQPVTNFTFFTLRNPQDTNQPRYSIGHILSSQIISNAAGGLNIILPNQEKGFVPNKRLNRMLSNSKDSKKSLDKKFQLNSRRQCRILDYVHLDQVYVCTFEPSVLKEKHFTPADVKVGELVTVKVIKAVQEGIKVAFGNLRGFIQNLHLSDLQYSENVKKRFSVGRTVQARVLMNSSKGIHLTAKQGLVNSDHCLSRCDESVLNKQYPGVVVHIAAGSILLAFYSDVRGMLYRGHLSKRYQNFQNAFYIGQVVTVTVLKINNDLLHLSLDPPSMVSQIKVGNYVDGTVSEVTEVGLQIDLSDGCKGFIPAAHLSRSLTLKLPLLETYKVGDSLKSLLCVTKRGIPILSIREAVAHKYEELDDSEDLKSGSIIRCSYVSEEAAHNRIYIRALFNHRNLTFRISKTELVDQSFDKTQLKFEPEQAIVVKLLDYDPTYKPHQIKLTAKLSEVFTKDYEYSVALLSEYLEDVDRIRANLAQKGNSLAKLKLGQRVQCKIDIIAKHGCKVSIKNNIAGFVSSKHCPKKAIVGQVVTGVVLWVNFAEKFVEISLLNSVIDNVNEIQDGEITRSFGNFARACLLIQHPEYVIAVLKNPDTSGQLIFLPPKLHENSFLGETCLEEMQKIKVYIDRQVNNCLIGMEKKQMLMLKKANKQIGIQKKSSKKKMNGHIGKVKTSDAKAQIESKDEGESDQNDETNGFDEEDEDINENEVQEFLEENEEDEMNGIVDDIQHSGEEEAVLEISDTDSEDNQSYNILKSKTKLKPNGKSNLMPALPGVQHFFTEAKVKFAEPDSSEEENDEDVIPKKKRKLTPTEKREQARLREEELIEKELANADLTAEPETIDHFQRALKGRPNDSELWSKYIAHLVANVEVEKAKSAAEEALQTISMSLTEDRFNIWIIRLNLENSYGDKTSFEEVFNEAVRCSDDLKIYMAVIRMLADAQKFPEMEEKILKAKRKFGQDSLDLWIEIGRIYYKLGKVTEARNLKDAGLLKLKVKSKQIMLIIKFAILEFLHGERNHGEALFETLLQHNPKRIDIWSDYIDQVRKQDDIKGARRIFDRAVSQSLPPKKMKVLLKKYKDFEKQYGTEDRVAYVIELANKYAAGL